MLPNKRYTAAAMRNSNLRYSSMRNSKMRTSNFYGGYGFNQGRNSSRNQRKSVGCGELDEIQSTGESAGDDPCDRGSYRPS